MDIGFKIAAITLLFFDLNFSIEVGDVKRSGIKGGLIMGLKLSLQEAKERAVELMHHGYH